MVYEDAEKLYREVAASGKHLLERAMQALFPHSVPLSLEDPLQKLPSWSNQGTSYPISASYNLTQTINSTGHQSRGGQVVGINTVHAPRREVVALPLTGPEVMRLKPAVVQLSKSGSVGYAVLQAGHEDAVATISATAANQLLQGEGAYGKDAHIFPVTPSSDLVAAPARCSYRRSGRICFGQ